MSAPVTALADGHGTPDDRRHSSSQLLLEFRELLRRQARRRGELAWRAFLHDVEVASWDASVALQGLCEKAGVLGNPRQLSALMKPEGPPGSAGGLGRQLVLRRWVTWPDPRTMGTACHAGSGQSRASSPEPARRLLAFHEARVQRRFARSKAELWLAIGRQAVVEAERIAVRLRATCCLAELQALRSQLAVSLSTPAARRDWLRWDNLETCAEEVGARRLLMLLRSWPSPGKAVRRLRAP